MCAFRNTRAGRFGKLPPLKHGPERRVAAFRPDHAQFSMRQLCSLRRDLARDQQIEPMPNRAGKIDEFGRHSLKSPIRRGSTPIYVR